MCIFAKKAPKMAGLRAAHFYTAISRFSTDGKMSIFFDIFPFAFDILSLSFVIPEGPAFALWARNERMPLGSRCSRFTVAGMSNENETVF